MSATRGILLLAHGTPESLDEMGEYLTRVRGGRPPSPELVEEMTGNYAAIGGRSPLTERTEAQARALAALTGEPVYVGMRNWKPFIADVLVQAAADGISELVAIPLAPQYSSLSTAKYRDAVEASRPADMTIRFVPAWHDEPLLIDAFAEKLRDARARETWDTVIFTAHSLPTRVVAEGDPYPDHVRATATAVAAAAGIPGFRSAYQSAGRTPEPWLGPPLEEAVAAAGAEGARRILVVPVGFVSDHTEILFDIDVQAARFGRERGLTVGRTASLNDSPTFIRALAAVVTKGRAAD
jgi:protoporphyrin/coproporphyrin ferrochelatase